MEKRPIKETLKEYGRGIIGGLLFSLPLLYTMELWWTGFTASPGKLLVYVCFTLLLLLGYNKYAGMKKDADFLAICRDSIEEIGLAFVLTFFFLLLIHKIDLSMSFDEISGKVIVESMVVAIGISVGTAQLGQEKNSGEEGEQEGQEKESKTIFHLMVLSICGAVLFSSSVAPTEEILKIAIVSTPGHLLLMVIISLLISAVILFFSDFKNSGSAEGTREVFLHILIGYVAALVVSFIFLWFFGRIGGNGFDVILAQIIVLAIPGSIGASAGRLLIG